MTTPACRPARPAARGRPYLAHPASGRNPERMQTPVIGGPAARTRKEPGHLPARQTPACQAGDVHGCRHLAPGSRRIRAGAPVRYHALPVVALLTLAQVNLPVPQVSLSGLIPLAVIGLAVWALVRRAGARLWHVLVAMAAGVALTGTIFGSDISILLSQISGGYL